MGKRVLCSALLSCAALIFTGSVSAQEKDSPRINADGTCVKTQSEGRGAPEIVPHRLSKEEAAPPAGSTAEQSPSITNHGGPVMGIPSVYLIWYGNWNQSNNSDTSDGQKIVRDFLTGLSGSPYYMTNWTYYGVSGTFSVAGEYSDKGSQGTRLTDSRVRAVVSGALSSKALPTDANGIYLVLTSSNISETSGFCSKYCGWHTASTIAGTDIKYAFIGNANRCLNSCAAQTVSPNENAGVDAMVSVIAHELEETNTDPDLNAWYDSSGAEDADKCAWTFGQKLLPGTGPSGTYYYNMTLGARNFLIQRELSGKDSKCYVSYDPSSNSGAQ